MPGNAELMKELNIPESMVPCCAVALGYTVEKYEAREIPDNRIKMFPAALLVSIYDIQDCVANIGEKFLYQSA